MDGFPSVHDQIPLPLEPSILVTSSVSQPLTIRAESEGLHFDELERQVSEALRRAGIHSATAAPRGTTVGQESQVVARRGGRVVATVGGNALFHLESDRWPGAVDVEAVARFANAYSDVARSLAVS